MTKRKITAAVSALLAAALMLMCGSCNANKKVDTWYKDVVCRNPSTRWSSCVLASGDSTYYITSNNISVHSKDGNEVLVDKVGAESLFVYNNQLYYLEGGRVFKVGTDEEGEVFTTEVCNSAKVEMPSGGPRNAFTDFCVTDKYVCLSSPTNYVISYNLAEEEYAVVCSNYSGGTVANNRLYYTTTNRDYTVYTIELSTLKKAKLLGAGKPRPQKNIYERLQLADGELYVANRKPAQITTIDVADEVLADKKDDKANAKKATSSTAKKDEEKFKVVINKGAATHVYFALNTDKLYYAYTADKVTKVVSGEKEFAINNLDATKSFIVVNDRIFYHTTDGQLVSVTTKFAVPVSSTESSSAAAKK